MLFIVNVTILNVDGSDVVREVGSDDFTPAVEHYLSAIEHCKGEVRWGDAKEARVTFVSMGRVTERTKIRFAIGGELEIIATV
jgi:hypothetical protein